MALQLTFETLADPDGHKPALLLKGDWLVARISDGGDAGVGEMSHSGDDAACQRIASSLFDKHIKDMTLDVEAMARLEATLPAASFIEQTAISGLNQALYDLIARRQGVSLWRLFADKPCRDRVPVYATINRALNDRSIDDYLRTIEEAIAQGFTAIKCAPFERVRREGDQIVQAAEGIERLVAIRDRLPSLSLRIDFHNRFAPGMFQQLLPQLEAVDPQWIEEPFPLGDAYADLRQWTRRTLAAGELFFGPQPFLDLIQRTFVDVIMPDVKHVGGLGPLIATARQCPPHAQVSPHNPSGPVATNASLHAAAVCPTITSLELPLITDRARAYYLPTLRDGFMTLS